MLVSGKVSVGLPGGLVGSKMGSLKSCFKELCRPRKKNLHPLELHYFYRK